MSNLLRFFLAVVSISPCLGGPGVLLTQDIAQKPIKVEVNVTTKLIQVSVTDKQGIPITDLTPADFQVTDNGKVVKIDHFEKHIYGGSDSSLPLPVSVPEEKPRLLSRKFFIIFDFAFLDQAGMFRAKRAALHFLDTVPQPEDEIALVTYLPAKNLSLQEYLTKDHRKVREIVESFGLRSVAGRAESLLDYYLALRRPDIPAAETRRQVLLNDGAQSGYVLQVIRFSEAMKNLAQTLRYIPGSKNVLFFSNGISRTTLYGRRANKIEIRESAGSPEEWADLMSSNDVNLSDSTVRDSYSKMLDAFKASNCRVYSFNETQESGEAVIEDPVEVKEFEAPKSDGLMNPREMAGGDSLRQFASVTGGKYYSNTMDYRKAMEDLKNVTGAYYVLGYVLDDKRDGAYHKTKVKVTRKGAKLSFQPGYFNPKSFSEFTDFERIVHLMDVALTDNPQSVLPTPATFTPVPVRAGGLGFFSAYARLSAESFGMFFGKDSEALVFVFDEGGHSVSIKSFNLAELPAGREGFLLDFAWPLPPGAYEGRLVLRNLKTGQAARGSAFFRIPAAAPAGIWMDPILLLEEGRNLYGLSPTPELSLSRMYGYDARTFLPRVGDIPRGTAKITVAVRCGGFGDGKDIGFIGSVLPKSGEQTRIPVPVTVMEQIPAGSTNQIRIEIGVSDLPAGAYTLDLIAQLKTQGVGGTTSTQIIIK